MRFTIFHPTSPWPQIGLGVAALFATNSVLAQSPQPSVPANAAAAGSAPTAASPLDPRVPPAVVPAAAATTREAQLEERIRQLEAMVSRLATQVNQVTPAAGAGTAAAGAGTAAGGGPMQPSGLPGGPEPRGTAGPDIGTAASSIAPSRTGGPGAPGQSLPPNPAPSERFNSPATLDSFKGNFRFGPGFELRTDDDEFIFQFHDLTQFEYRGYLQGGQAQVHDTFAFPRQWWMFSGRLTKPFGYFFSFSNGFDTFSLLDVFLDLDFTPWLRAKIGRFKTPFTYEFLVEPIQGLVTPERSLFFNNFGQNRDDGIMVFGRLLNNSLDYAGGIFNGTRNGILAQQNGKATSWFLNWRPFGNEENTLLENFKFGGSVFACNFDQAPIPQTFRTVVPTTGNALIGTPFLNLNNNVKMHGPMALWDLHVAYFYRGLALVGEWGGGYQSYAIDDGHETRIPVGSFYVQASYLITGETRSGIGVVRPNRPVNFGRGNGWQGIGAWEPYFRFSYLDINKQIFTAGFADPNLWTNRLYQTDVGINWHLTHYVKIYMDWIHDGFGQPVLFAPGRRQLTADTFLLRFQFYF